MCDIQCAFSLLKECCFSILSYFMYWEHHWYETFLCSRQTKLQWNSRSENARQHLFSQSAKGLRISTWCQPRWDLPSDSTRRSKSSCHCLQDDRLWWHESTGRTGDACRLCNVCRAESQICDTDRDEEGREEWIKRRRMRRTRKNIHLSLLVCYAWTGLFVLAVELWLFLSLLSNTQF